MKRFLPFGVILLLLAVPGRAQEAPKPEFDNAPVGELLVWAQKALGVGFVYEGKDLLDPATGQSRKVTSKGTAPQTRAEKQVLMLELLRRAGLVAFELGPARPHLSTSHGRVSRPAGANGGRPGRSERHVLWRAVHSPEAGIAPGGSNTNP